MGRPSENGTPGVWLKLTMEPRPEQFEKMCSSQLLPMLDMGSNY